MDANRVCPGIQKVGVAPAIRSAVATRNILKFLSDIFGEGVKELSRQGKRSKKQNLTSCKAGQFQQNFNWQVRRWGMGSLKFCMNLALISGRI